MIGLSELPLVLTAVMEHPLILPHVDPVLDSQLGRTLWNCGSKVTSHLSVVYFLDQVFFQGLTEFIGALIGFRQVYDPRCLAVQAVHAFESLEAILVLHYSQQRIQAVVSDLMHGYGRRFIYR